MSEFDAVEWARKRRTVWMAPDWSIWVPRCGRCGKYKAKEEFREHWFFNGLYCLTCIVDVLYDNARNLEELP